MKYRPVTCSVCGRVDKSVPAAHYMGTSVKMYCPECGTPDKPTCRLCCPTGHGTFSTIDAVDQVKKWKQRLEIVK